MSSRITSWVARGLTVALTGIGLLALGGPPAAAATTVIRCVGTIDVAYSPGLTNVVQTVSFTGGDHAQMCAGRTTPNLRSFEGPFKGTGTESCAGRFEPGASTEILYWNGTTNLTSFWQFSYTVKRSGDSVIYTATGPVTSGVLAGTILSQEMVEPFSDFDGCSQPDGMKFQRGTSTWTFTS